MERQGLMNGSSLLKVSSKGKATKRHVFLSEDANYVKWLPSRKKLDEDFVALSHVATVQQGRIGARLDGFGPSAECEEAQQWLQFRREGGAVETMSGYLEKLGGAKGGRSFSPWAKRWFVLHGTQLVYYASPADAKAKGVMDVSGSVCGPSRADGRAAFSITWSGGGGGDGVGGDQQPARRLRADSPATTERWMAALARAVRLAKTRAAAERAAGPRAPQLRAGGAGSALLHSPQPDDERLCFTLTTAPEGGADDGGPDDEAAGGGKKGSRGGGGKSSSAHSFMAGSSREFEAWFCGLLGALDARAHGPATPKNAPAREARWRALLAQRPDEAAAIGCLLARAQEAQPGRQDAALASYRAAAAEDPCSPAARGGLGRLLLTVQRDPAGALPHLEAALLLTDYEEPHVVCAYGRALVELGRAAAAAGAAAGGGSPSGGGKAAAASKRGGAASTGAAAAAEFAKHAAAVLAHCVALEAPARSAATSAALGEALAMLGRHAEAAGHLRDAAALVGSAVPGLPLSLLVALAACLGATGSADEAATVASAAAAHGDAGVDAPALRRRAVTQLAALARWREVVPHAEALLPDAPEALESILEVAAAYYRAEAARAAGEERVGAGIHAAAKAAAGSRGSRGRDPTLDEEDGEAAGGGDGDDDDGGGGGGSGPRGGAARRSAADPASTPPSAGSLVLEPPPRGALAPDGMSPTELCAAAERHLVAALTLAPESPRANILCAQVYVRLAQLERDAEAEAAAARGSAAAAGPPTGDEVAASGWTPNQRLAKAEEWYGYVALAYPDDTEAPLLLGTLLKTRGRYDEAGTYLRLVCERSEPGSPPHAQATDQLARVGRLAEGKPEVDEAAEKEARRAARAAARAAAEAAEAEAAAAAKAARVAGKAKARAEAEAAAAAEAAEAEAAAEARAATKAAATAKAKAAADAQAAAAAAAAAASSKKAAASPGGRGRDVGDEDDDEAAGGGGEDDGGGEPGGDEGDDEVAAGFSGDIPMGGGGGKKGEDAEIEMGAAVDAAAMAGLSQDERKKAYFKAMADAKKAKEDEETRREKAKVAAMTPEERAEYERQQAEEGKRAKQKDKALTSGLGQYGKGGAAGKLLASRGGRGRGRGR